MYRDTKLLMNGIWASAAANETLMVRNPATGDVIGTVAHARSADLDRALEAAERGYKVWRETSAFQRAAIMRKAAVLFRERAETVARFMTLEQGKPIAEARMEVERGAETIDWLAGEAERLYSRVIPSRVAGTIQIAIKSPVGPVAAFAPWNFPVNQLVRKVASALAAGCSIIVKGPEEAPASGAELVRAFVDAGVPDGVINLVFGTPSEISTYLIKSPIIRKVSFTGSTAVGRELAALAGQHLKVITLELGGHAPVIIFDDADIEWCAGSLAVAKFRNAGQSCISPTRFLVQRGAYARFLKAFVEAADNLKVGDGSLPDTQMGPMANDRRTRQCEEFIEDALRKGAVLKKGGKKIQGAGYFFEPTILADVPLTASAMNEEPFGPIALVRPFETLVEALAEANRLPYGLAAYVFSGSAKTADVCASGLDSGMVATNSLGLGHPETPFGGVQDSGYGIEGGSEAIEAYLTTRFVTTDVLRFN